MSTKKKKKSRAKKPAATKVATVSKKPAVKITLKVYPHVIHQYCGDREEPAERIMQPTPDKIASRKAILEEFGNVVTVEHYDAKGNPLPQ